MGEYIRREIELAADGTGYRAWTRFAKFFNLSELMNMSSPAVSHHLRSLRTSGLLISRREGKEVYYRAADTPQSRLLHQMIEMVMQIACPEEEQ